MARGLPRTTARRIKANTFTVATAPSAVGKAGAEIYVTNGAAGQPIQAVSDGTNWKRVDSNTNISAT